MILESRGREQVTKYNWEKLIELLKGHRVWIETHNFPDPDAIASAYGLQYFLAYYGIPSKICYNGRVDKISVAKMVECFQIEMIPVGEADLLDTDYIVLVDGQKYNANMTDIIGEEVACIDHHPTTAHCEYQYKDIRITGSCSSLIAEYIKESGMPISQKIASALSYGLRMDTDSFNRGVTKLEIAMFDYLYEYTDQDLVRKMYNSNMELSDLRAYGAAIQNIQIYGHLGLAYLPFECEDALIAMVSDFILKLDIVTVAFIYAEKQGGLKFSVRSEEASIHAGNLVMRALSLIGGNGGGHATMAGGFIPAENRSSDKDKEHYQVRERFMTALKEMELEISQNKAEK